jgi:hypothetical protein
MSAARYMSRPMKSEGRQSKVQFEVSLKSAPQRVVVRRGSARLAGRSGQIRLGLPPAAQFLDALFELFDTIRRFAVFAGVHDGNYIIRAGRVLCHGTAEEVLANPEARKYYFGEGPGLDAA